MLYDIGASILKQMPKSIEKRISETSSNKDIFDESIKPYKDALKESGFSEALNYIAPTTNKKQKNRKQKIIWFNPPFSKSVKSNIGRIFLRLLPKHFPWNHTMHKIFNRNTVKVSYSCLRNISSIISPHNLSIFLTKQESYTHLIVSVRLHRFYTEHMWLTTGMMQKKFISD